MGRMNSSSTMHKPHSMLHCQCYILQYLKQFFHCYSLLTNLLQPEVYWIFGLFSTAQHSPYLLHTVKNHPAYMIMLPYVRQKYQIEVQIVTHFLLQHYTIYKLLMAFNKIW